MDKGVNTVEENFAEKKKFEEGMISLGKSVNSEEHKNNGSNKKNVGNKQSLDTSKDRDSSSDIGY